MVVSHRQADRTPFFGHRRGRDGGRERGKERGREGGKKREKKEGKEREGESESERIKLKNGVVLNSKRVQASFMFLSSLALMLLN